MFGIGFFLCLSLVQCVDYAIWRTCKDSPFCTRNRRVGAQGWIAHDAQKVGKEFRCLITDKTYNNQLVLAISFLELQAPRIRIRPEVNESFTRYDVSKQDAVVDQVELTRLLDIEVVFGNTLYQIKSANWTVVVHCEPFHIDYQDAKGNLLVTLNARDTAIFEAHRPAGFGSPDTFMQHVDKLKNGANSVALDATFYGEGITFSGLPAHTLPLTLPQTSDRGDPIRLENSDIWEFDLNSRMAMYGCVPLLWGHSNARHTAIFWLNPSETWVDITYEGPSQKTARFLSESGFIDVFLFKGDKPVEISDAYTRLTGRPQLQPQFAFGYHQSRWGYSSEKIWLGISEKLDAANIPHDVMWLDSDYTNSQEYMVWNRSAFPDPAKMLDTLAQSKRHAVCIIDPHLAAHDTYRMYQEARQRDYVLHNPDGKQFVATCWPGNALWIDYLNPAARDWWATQYAYDHFLDSRPNLFAWNDMNEPSVFDFPEKTAYKDLLHWGGYEEREVHNLYGLLMTQGTYKGLVQRDADQNTRPFILTRSWFAGCQKFSSVWTGDNRANWTYMRASIAQVLSMGIAGVVYQGSDVGGFIDGPAPDLLSRWYQLGAWTYPFFRVHCGQEPPSRELYTLEGDYFRIAKEAVYERYRLLPYWYTLAHRANLTGEPLVRPLWWEFGSSYADVDDQVMIGSGLLVAPFLDQGSAPMTLSLPPSNRWYEYRTGSEVQGTIVIQSVNASTPVFLRGGQIVVYRASVKKSAPFMYYDPISLFIALDDRGYAEGELYLDNPESHNFLFNDYIFKKIVYKSQTLTLSSLGNGNPAYAAASPVIIETLTILGTKTPIRGVRLGAKSLPFERVNGAIVLRDLTLKVGDTWSIKIE